MLAAAPPGSGRSRAEDFGDCRVWLLLGRWCTGVSVREHREARQAALKQRGLVVM